jgi:hypothetical protein
MNENAGNDTGLNAGFMASHDININHQAKVLVGVTPE